MSILHINNVDIEISDEHIRSWLQHHVVDNIMDVTWEFAAMLDPIKHGKPGIIVKSLNDDNRYQYKKIYLNLNNTETYLHFKYLGYNVKQLFDCSAEIAYNI